ncbi:hypothetical protein [Lacinutrix sp.]|uniref:hypothetical protein n=1 Tax=Lacinutrix sp. TaxID=1937692 RepID=UPI0025C706D0|nr:hypothetical protein [Lacinutrix sp.]
MTNNYLNTIKNQLKLLLIIFGGIVFLICLFTGLYKSWENLIYPTLFVTGLTTFCLFVLISIDFLKKMRENRFFKKEPYNQIDKKTVKKRTIVNSKYDFPKTQRIIKLDGNEYAIEYYDDFFKIPISDVLLVYNLTDSRLEPISINYKEKKYSDIELFDAIRNA